MNIDEVLRRGRPETVGWARSEAGQRVLDEVVAAAAAADSPGHTVTGWSRASRPVLRWSFLGTGLVGAAAAAVLAVSAITTPQGVQDSGPPVAGGQSGGAQVTARDILLAAATEAERAPAESGRYWHVKTLDVYGPLRVGAKPDQYDVLRRTITETWQASAPRDADWTGRREFGARPRSDADERAWRDAGSPTEWALDADSSQKVILSTEPDAGHLTRNRDTDPRGYLPHLGWLSLEQVQQLPDVPGTLRDWVTSRIHTEVVRKNAERGFTTDDATINRIVFETLGQLLLETPAPPKVRAAAFRIFADIAGVRSLGTVQDESGRSGQGVEFSDGTDIVRMIVDSSTHRLLATKFTATLDGQARPVKEHSRVVLAAEWSDAAPQVPTLPQK